MTYESLLSNIIVRLKEYRQAHPEYTLQKISDHTGISMSTVTRIFAEGSENQSFRYESIRPIAKLMLNLDDLDDGDDDEKALKSVIQFKDTMINQLKQEKEEEKAKFERKLEKERSQARTSIEFLKHQIDLKDDRITLLLNALEDRSEQYKDLNAQYKELHTQYDTLMSQLLTNKKLIQEILKKEE